MTEYYNTKKADYSPSPTQKITIANPSIRTDLAKIILNLVPTHSKKETTNDQTHSKKVTTTDQTHSKKVIRADQTHSKRVTTTDPNHSKRVIKAVLNHSKRGETISNKDQQANGLSAQIQRQNRSVSNLDLENKWRELKETIQMIKHHWKVILCSRSCQKVWTKMDLQLWV